MADNTVLDPGTGGDTVRDKDRAGVKTPIVGLDINAAGSEVLGTGDATNGLDVDVTRVQGTVTVAGAVTNAGTFATQDSDKIADNAGFTDGTSKVVMNGYVLDEVAGTALTENDAAAARIDSKRAQVGVIEDATTRGQRAAVSAANALKVDGSAVTQPVSGTVTANAGSGTLAVSNAGTFAVQDSEKITDNAGFTDGTSKVLLAGHVFDEVAGTALTENDAAASRIDSKRAQVLVIEDATTRGQRATVSAAGAVKTDGSAVTQPVSGTVTANAGTGPFPVSDNAGSLTVDAPLGTPVFVTPTPSTTGGWSKVAFAAQTTTVQTVKGSAGNLGGYYFYNPNASVAYVQVFDVAGAVTLGTTVPDLIYAIPPASAANVDIANGVNFANAIKLACTTTATGSTAPTTGLDLSVYFK